MIVIFGEFNLDIFYSFKDIVNSPTLQTSNPQIPIEIHPGGKGANHAVALVKAGGEAKMAGIVGNDQAGELLKEALKEYGADVSHIEKTDLMHTASVMISKKKGFFGSTILSGNNANLMNNANSGLELLNLVKDIIPAGSERSLGRGSRNHIIYLRKQIPLIIIIIGAVLDNKRMLCRNNEEESFKQIETR